MESDELQSLISEEQRKKQKAGVICSDCCSRRPLRTVHCSQCYRCVIRFDHHSLLLNNCIGYDNQVYYFFLLLFCILQDYISCYCIVRWLHVSMFTHSKATFIWFTFRFLCLVIDTLYTILLFKRFSDNILSNLTQYEADHYYRIGYLKDTNFKFKNPFYSSTFKSILEFFHISGIHWSDCDIFSLVDLSINNEAKAQPTSNVVVDTLRLVSGIPQSRIKDILNEEKPTEDYGEEMHELL